MPPETADALIGRLTADLRPVRRLWPPAWRAAAWLGIVLLVGGAMAARADLPAVARRLMAFPDMWLAVAGSIATAVLAALAATMLSLPDRSWRWSLAPLPAVAVWLGASGMGCLRTDLIARMHTASMADAVDDCMPFILRMSAILAIPLGILLWRARPLRPGLVSATGGLAVAAGSASLLWLVHPFDASAVDLAAHIAAVLIVIGACRLVGLMGRFRPAPSRSAGAPSPATSFRPPRR